MGIKNLIAFVYRKKSGAIGRGGLVIGKLNKLIKCIYKSYIGKEYTKETISLQLNGIIKLMENEMINMKGLII